MDINATLAERDKRYGCFEGHAQITIALKHRMEMANGWHSLSCSQQEALHMIAHKIGRILNGDPNYADSWIDIAGYAQLVANALEEEID